MKPAKILFFVDGPAPSPEDYAAAAEMSATVNFRNARAVPSEPHALEICDGVAGAVPPLYAERFPTAEEAIAKKADELKALSSKVGDTPAPKKATAAKTDAKSQQAANPAQTPAPGQQGAAPAAWNPNPAQ